MNVACRVPTFKLYELYKLTNSFMRDELKQTLLILLLVAIQVLVLNNIHLFGLACPYLYIWAILALPVAMSPALVMVIAFALGFVIDIFCNSYGIHTSATVLVAFLRPYIMRLVASRENLEKPYPSIASFGSAYYLYAAVLIVIHHLMLFSLEAFSFAHTGMVLLKTLCSAIFTFVLVICIEFLKNSRR